MNNHALIFIGALVAGIFLGLIDAIRKNTADIHDELRKANRSKETDYD